MVEAHIPSTEEELVTSEEINNNEGEEESKDQIVEAKTPHADDHRAKLNAAHQKKSEATIEGE